MWIRSQNKKDLFNAQELISIQERSTGDIFSDPKDDVVYYEIVTGIDRIFTLGIYESEEEALKVLDMIEKHTGDMEYVKFYELDFIPPVFQMPPAGFSKAGDPE